MSSSTVTIEELAAEVRRLRDYEEIRRLMYRYARGVDRNDGELIASVYAPGGTDWHGSFDGPGSKFATICVEDGKATDLIGNHHITNMVIELDGDIARVETYFLAFHPHADDGTPKLGVMCGRYLDVLARRDGGWGVKRREVVSDWSRDELLGPHWPRASAEIGGFISGGRGSDRSYAHFASTTPDAAVTER